MKIKSFEIAGPLLISPTKFSDDRGWFSETYRQDKLAEAGVADLFVQDNQSFSVHVGTIRGLHFQIEPFAQAKLVRVLSGSIFDVALDLRQSSPTFGRHVSVTLDAQAGDQFYIPAGFAHGFCTLEPNTMVAYKVNAYYSRDCDRNLLWSDPALGINWPVTATEAVVSDKDRAAPYYANLGAVFP